MNETQLIGRLTRDVDLKYTQGGHAVANFILAVNRTYKNGEGNYEADFIRIQAWRKLAENAANHLHKGSLVGITGNIRTRHYEDQDTGKRIYITEVVADFVQFLDPRKNDGQQNQDLGQYNSPSQQYNNSSQQNVGGYGGAQSGGYDDPFSTGGGPIEVSDDDLPF